MTIPLIRLKCLSAQQLTRRAAERGIWKAGGLALEARDILASNRKLHSVIRETITETWPDTRLTGASLLGVLG